VATTLTFEHPLNERARTQMRLEHLFEKLAYLQPQDNPWASRALVETLLDIATISSRADIKTELIKELDRQAATLERVRDKPGVSRKALEGFLAEINTAVEGLRNLERPIGQRIRENEFLKGVAQRGSLPGGTCGFDLPSTITGWPGPCASVTVRSPSGPRTWRPSEPPSTCCSTSFAAAAPRAGSWPTKGLYQESLESPAPAQLIRIAVEADPSLFPEISGHKNRFAIRFLRGGVEEAPEPIRDDLEFSLTCCVL
jgi:cell division protein ZapD